MRTHRVLKNRPRNVESNRYFSKYFKAKSIIISKSKPVSIELQN